jgi:hypothetical protein
VSRSFRLVVGALALIPRIVAAQTAATVEEFLAKEIGFTAAEIRTVTQGGAVAKLVPSANDREVTVFGAVRIAVPRSFFVQGQLDFQRSLRTATRPALGIFGDPPKVEDVAAFQLGRDDLEDLKSCKPGSCDMKLPATEMTRMGAIVDLSAPDAAARVSAYARTRLVDLVADYRRRGNAAMVVYADRGNVSGEQAFEQMLAETTYLYRYTPSFHEHLIEFPRSRLPGASEVIYWAVDEMPRMKPVMRVSHQIVYSPPELEAAAIVASKMLYANHYFEAGLEILTAIDGEGGSSGSEITLLLLRRYRFDQLPAGLLNIRKRVSESVRDQGRADLVRLKAEHEQARKAGTNR